MKIDCIYVYNYYWIVRDNYYYKRLKAYQKEYSGFFISGIKKRHKKF